MSHPRHREAVTSPSAAADSVQHPHEDLLTRTTMHGKVLI
jgi:hypothetical protein